MDDTRELRDYVNDLVAESDKYLTDMLVTSDGVFHIGNIHALESNGGHAEQLAYCRLHLKKPVDLEVLSLAIRRAMQNYTIYIWLENMGVI